MPMAPMSRRWRRPAVRIVRAPFSCRRWCYTKLVGPALRVGFVAAELPLVTRLIERKVLSVLSGSTLLESYVSEVLAGGRYKRHVEQVRTRLARMRRDARIALESTGVEFAAEPGEGMFLWGRVPESAPVDELVRRARDIVIGILGLAIWQGAEIKRGRQSSSRVNLGTAREPW